MIHNHHSNLAQILNEVLLEGRGFPHQSSGGFRPSEASVTIAGPKTLGHCPRNTWYRLKRVEPSNIGRLPHQQKRMDVGKAVENDLVEDCQSAGIFIDRKIPFKVVLDGVPISGELDVVARTSPCGANKYILECKSMYGYAAQKDIFGRYLNLSSAAGKPRDSYVMQTALYLRHFSTLPEDDPCYIPFGCIYVCDRGDGHFCTFDVWLNRETRVLGGDESITIHEIWYHSDDMGIGDTRLPYTVEDILQNYRMIQSLLPGEIPPEKPLIREYDQETVEMKYQSGDISESAYKKWTGSHGPRGKGKEVLGDWACGVLYCPWSDLCWGK